MLSVRNDHTRCSCQLFPNEGALNVPENARLNGGAWVASFCKAHGIKERRRDGEAASVDMAAVTAEQERVRKVLLNFTKPKDKFNFDETGLFAL